MKLAWMIVLAGCSSAELAPPVLRARSGPAIDRAVHRVLAVPASCGTLSLVRVDTADPDRPTFQTRAACPPDALHAIDIAVRSSLEFGGFQIIDSEQLNAVTASRLQIERTTDGGPSSVETHTDGARFEDATPFQQTAILADLRAEGLLTIRISVGAPVGFSQRRTVAVQAQLLALDRALVWARRCELEVSGFTTDEVAMERAARCATEGVRAR
ncbi:MAG: hypothetical protein ABI867_27800 [Kofleriaceae bacterium]